MKVQNFITMISVTHADDIVFTADFNSIRGFMARCVGVYAHDCDAAIGFVKVTTHVYGELKESL